ncbi:MAG: ribonuclease III [Erythrobacter sp.]
MTLSTTDLCDETRAWLADLGIEVRDESVWLAALTHGSSQAPEDYQRLEFLGDRVLGLSVAYWLFRDGVAPEGKLSQRLNALVSGATCARIARSISISDHVRLGKQAREDGGADSDNILGDVMESLLGACFIEHGFETTRDFIYRTWESELSGNAGQSKHPKSALQEWAAGNQHRSPKYEITDRSGPDHAARFTVRVSVHTIGQAEATAASKSEAEKIAAKEFMEKFG